MKELISKLEVIERETRSERGQYDLFALFLRESSPNKWDILVSADWIRENEKEGLAYFYKKLQDSFTSSDFLKISAIVNIEENNPGLADLRGISVAKQGITEIKDINLFGLDIEKAYLLVTPSKESVQAA